MAELDEIDRSIVTALQEDGRASMRALAERLNIARATAYARVRRLEAEEVIAGYTAVIDPVRYGRGLSAYVNLKIAQQSWRAVLAEAARIPEVEHAALVSGENDVILLVRTSDITTLREMVLTRFQEVPGVLSTQTVLIFDEMTPRHHKPGFAAEQ
jgi:DNA-binding Lrp family transcriptional regulator